MTTDESIPGIEQWNARRGESLPRTLEMTFEEVRPERVVITMPVGPRVHQPLGLLHGGASVALAETAASTGAALNCAEGKVAVGQEINANHVRGIREGLLRATAVPVHVGRTSQVWSIEVRDGDGKLVCTSRCTLAVIDLPPGTSMLPR